MKQVDMDKHFGYTSPRFEKIGYNIRKFYLQEKELQSYHKELINMGREEIDTIGVRETSRVLAEKYGVQPKTIKHDIGLMKRYGTIK